MKDLELKALIGMHRNTNRIDRQTNKIARDCDLTFSQFAVMEALYSKGDMSISEVRDIILSSVGTIPVIVNNLEKREYIKRLSDSKDKRISILTLTDSGRKIIEKAIILNNEMIKNEFSLLDDDEKIELVRILKKLGGKA